MTPKVSVIIPVYNAAPFLEQCLKSLQIQTFTDFELILIDDGSTDASYDICEAYEKKDQRIRLFYQKNAGQSAARNRGLDQARGEWITFIDSDDFVSADYLEKLIEPTLTEEVELVSCKMTFYNAEDGALSELTASNQNQYFHDNQALMSAYLQEEPFHFGPVTKLYRRDLLGNIRFSEGKIYEDYFFNFQYFSKIEHALALDYAGYYYVRNAQSTSRSAFRLKELDNISEQHLVLVIVEEEYPSLLPLAAYNLLWAYYWFFSKILNGTDKAHQKEYFEALYWRFKKDQYYLKKSLPLKNAKHRILLFLIAHFPKGVLFAYRFRKDGA